MGYTENFYWFKNNDDADRFIELYYRNTYLSRSINGFGLVEVLTVNCDYDMVYKEYNELDEEDEMRVKSMSSEERDAFFDSRWVDTSVHFNKGHKILWLVGQRGDINYPEAVIGLDKYYQDNIKEILLDCYPDTKDDEKLEECLHRIEMDYALHYITEDDIRLLNECEVICLDQVKDVDALLKSSTFTHTTIVPNFRRDIEIVEDRGLLIQRNKTEVEYRAELDEMEKEASKDK